jgi:AcrR family transcriptional regulator
MARSGPRASRRDDPSATRQRIVTAAIDTLRREGYAGTSARAVAGAGGFTQGVVFYHFGSMTELLLAALDETSRLRRERYEAAAGAVSSLDELMAVAAAVFREDLEAGHIKVLSELMAASSTIPELGPAIAQRIQPWVDFTEATVQRVLGTSGLAALVPARDVATAIVALYLGLELLTDLDGDHERATSLFASAQALATLLTPLLGSPTNGRDHG